MASVVLIRILHRDKFFEGVLILRRSLSGNSRSSKHANLNLPCMSQNHPDMSEGAAEGRSSYFPRYPLHAGGVLCSMSGTSHCLHFVSVSHAL